MEMGKKRRSFLTDMGAGFTAVALSDMLTREGYIQAQSIDANNLAYENPLKAKKPPMKAKAKSVIFLFMYGGPSQVDTFDYKPDLFKLDGKTIDVKTHGRGGKKNQGRVVGPKWKFNQYGESGAYVSDLFPFFPATISQ